MNNTVLTYLLTGFWDKGPDYVLLVLVVTTFFISRELYLANRRQGHFNKSMLDTQNNLESKIEGLGVRIHRALDEFREEFRSECKEIREEFRSECKEIRMELKATKDQIEGRLTNIEYTLKDIRNDIKILDLKHNALETRVTKIESGDEKIPKSKQA
jgi:hypothetical protein